MNIGVVGLGNMGSAIAANLLRRGHSVTVYNRTRSKAEAMVKAGARVASSPAGAANGADVVVTMLADDFAVEDATLSERGILRALSRGCIHLSMSTISVHLSRKLAREHARAGQGYVAAPVLGRPEAAARAQLVIIAAGAADAIDRCAPILEAAGRKTERVGDKPERANAVKLGANFMLATVLEALGEAYALARSYDVNDETFLSIINDGLFQSPVVEAYGKRISEGVFDPAGFKLRLGLKDVRLAVEAAEGNAVPMALASVVRDRFVAAIARGRAEMDWSAVGAR